MKLDEIIKLMEAAESMNFDTVEMEQEDFYIKLDRNKPAQIHVPAHYSPAIENFAAAPIQTFHAAPAASPPDETAETTTSANPAAPAKAPGSKDITSPLVGIFHELPGDKAVKIGTRLKKGDTVCMVEAMKLMNEIHMPEDGEIVWAALEEGDTVEYEQLLFSYVK